MTIARKIFLIILMLGLITTGKQVYGQEHPLSFSFYDSITYAGYLKNDWQQVKLYGKEALKAGIDFFYLRVRMGDAFYYSGNYRKAISHYGKALKLNSADEYTGMMNYHALMNVGDRDKAFMQATRFSKLMKEKAGIATRQPVDFIYLESGLSLSSINESDRVNVMGSDSIYGEREFQRKLGSFHLGSRFRLFPSAALYIGYSGLAIEREKRLGYTTTEIQRTAIVDTTYGKAYYYSFPTNCTDTVLTGRIHQDDFYISLDYSIKGDWTLSPSVHLFRIRSSSLYPDYQVFTRSDTAYYLNFDNSWHLFNYDIGEYDIVKRDTGFSNYVLSLSVKKELGLFSTEFYGSVSNFNNTSQSQAGVSCTWFPFGNTNLFGSMRITSVLSDNKSRLVFEPSAGGRPAKNFWLSGFLTFGDLDLFNDRNGFIVYNQADPIRFRAGADGMFQMGKHLELFLYYRYFVKIITMLEYARAVPPQSIPIQASIVKESFYRNHSLTGGIKWKF